MTEHHDELTVHGGLSYLQLPAADVDRSARFYAGVFGWVGDSGFTAPGLIGQWVDDRPADATSGPLLSITVDDLDLALRQAPTLGGRVVDQPRLDGGERWLATVQDPGGNLVGLVQLRPRA